MQQGEIIVLPVPYTDLASQKLRPSLIISKSDRPGDDVIVAMITSSEKYLSQEHTISITDKNLSEGTLPKDSFIRCEKVFCLNKKLIRKSVARIDKKTLEAVKKQVVQNFI